MIDRLLALAAESPITGSIDIERLTMGGGLASLVIYMTVHGLPFLFKRWSESQERVSKAREDEKRSTATMEKELDDSRTQNQRLILELMRDLHRSISDITVAQRQLIERGIEATGRAENHADNMERIAQARAA